MTLANRQFTHPNQVFVSGVIVPRSVRAVSGSTVHNSGIITYMGSNMWSLLALAVSALGR